MRNKPIALSSLAIMVTVMITVSPAASAQVVTLGQALKAPAPAQQSEEVKSVQPKREPARAHLAAIYGHSAFLRAAITLNGVTTEAKAGDVVRAGTTICRVSRIQLDDRCVSLAQVSRAGDICPARVCWTGEPPPVEPDTDPIAPRAGRDLGMPPVPVPAAPGAKR
jgi:hypothetical protein